MLLVGDASRGALLESGSGGGGGGGLRATLVAMASMPRVFAPSVAARAVACLHALWRLVRIGLIGLIDCVGLIGLIMCR